MRLSFRIWGRVQGVGYRWFVKETAACHKISGWVRNTSEGTVEGEAQGPIPALDGFLNGLKTGHSGAAVDGVQTQELLDNDTRGMDFQIRPSA